ncbi:MAG: hypothetical protein MAG794_00186 [Gammaproteobacteria bacterium]|nr:hypothetical protein [Gammaproteobacteria bacterium]
MWSNAGSRVTFKGCDVMIGKFLGRMFGVPGDSSGGEVVAGETYKGFEIHAAPVKEANGWRISGVVSKNVDGADKIHEFIRADTCPDAESAAAMTLRKAKRLIDERGERIFD